MAENNNIKLPLGDVSLSNTLGTYYIDMRPALIHYTPKNVWHGKFDENGVPMLPDGKDSFYYSCVNIAQYGFILHAEYLESKDKKTLQTLLNCIRLLEDMKTEDDNTCVWLYNTYLEKYDLSPPWASAMAQGEAISLYLRVYQITKDENLKSTAQKAYNYLKISYDDGGVMRRDKYNNLWFEEYPSKEPSFVLNGFIYCLFGLYDLYRVTQKKKIKKDIDECILTLKNNLHKFDAGYWSYYDLLKKELVKYYYQKNVHPPQLEVLYKLTNEEIFNIYKAKWEKTITPINFLFVKLMYRVKPRIDKLFLSDGQE